MTPKPDIDSRFRELIKKGLDELSLAGWDGYEYRSDKYPRNSVHIELLTAGLSLVHRVCGGDSDHYRMLHLIGEDERQSRNGYYLFQVLPILETAHEDYQRGFLFDLRSIVHAEVFNDFLEQSEHLLEAGFHVPAASLAGAVLEDTLRKLCDRRGIAVPERTKIDKLNTALYKDEAYNRLDFKTITATADVRNNADHGHFDKFTPEDVKDMVRWIRRFTTDQLV